MSLTSLQQKISYTFAKPELLVRALTHPSKGGDHYERLEFLGDRLLAAVIGDWLFQRYPDADQGELSRRYAAMVREEALAGVGASWGLAEEVILGPGETMGASILADVVEAVLGAVWVDGGNDFVKAIVWRDWDDLMNQKDEKDPKTRLQEWLQAQGLGLPVYETVEEVGPAHDKGFTVKVTTPKGDATGEGRSKQAAGAAAAKAFLEERGE